MGDVSESLPDVTWGADFTVGTAALTIVAIATCWSEDDPVLRYDWDFGDGSSPWVHGPPSPSHTFPKPGEYVVRLTVWFRSGRYAGRTQRVVVGGQP